MTRSSPRSLLLRSATLALAALGCVPAVAQTAAPAQQVVTVTPVPAPIAKIPGVTIRYYDVTGTTVEELNASVAAQRPKDAASGVPIPSTADWSIGVSMQKATTGADCKITGATAKFTGNILLPRLANAEAVPAAVRTHWETYVAGLETRQAAILRQPYSRLAEVEQAVMASSCTGAGDAANKAIERITKAPPPPPAPPVTAAPAAKTP